MAGAGFKDFNSGDVLTASDVDTYLMQQTVMVFDDAAARTTALTGVVAEGMLSYLKDTNAVEVYDGSSWVASDDPNAIQNSIVDAKGDLISATADNTPARLAVGADNTVLTADSSTSTGLKWAAAASGGGMTLLASGTLSGSSTSITSISGAYKNLQLWVDNFTTSTTAEVGYRVNSNTGTVYDFTGVTQEGHASGTGGSAFAQFGGEKTSISMNTFGIGSTDGDMHSVITFFNYANTTASKNFLSIAQTLNNTATRKNSAIYAGGVRDNNAITSIQIITSAGTWSSGNYALYGVE